MQTPESAKRVKNMDNSRLAVGGKKQRGLESHAQGGACMQSGMRNVECGMRKLFSSQALRRFFYFKENV